MRFASDISILWMIPWLGVSVAIGLWYYRNVPWLKEVSKTWSALIKTLRISSIFLIGVLLIGLILETVNYREEKPVLITLVDNSSSMMNYKDSSQVKSQLKKLNESLGEELSDRFDFVSMTVGSSAEYGSNYQFKDAKTNLSKGFERIFEDYYNRNVGAVLLVSDGNFNDGPNPVYSAEKINLTPVFPLIVGDTIRKRDQYIKNVNVNDLAFFKNKFPVEVDIESMRFGKEEVKVNILRDGQVISSKNVKYEGNQVDFQHLTFELDADKIGYQVYTVEVSKASREYNYENNRRNFYIEVIDSRSKVLLLAGAPHPDISALKQELEKDENLEVVSHQMKDWDKQLSKVDMVVIHEPGYNMDNTSLRKIMDSKIPVLFVIGPNANSAVIKDLGIGINIPSGKQMDDYQASFNDGFAQFEVGEEIKKSMDYYPPLKTKFGELKISGAEILAFQRIGSVRKKDPLIFFTKRNGIKYGVIYGEGIWKWRMNEFARSGDHKVFNELISKIGQYLLVKQNTSALRIDVPKRITKNEEIIVNASFYNESLEPITSPKIEFTVKNDKGKVSRFQFGATGKSYRLNIGRLNSGKYTWTATSKYDGKSHSKSGVFIVEDVDLEMISNSANGIVLKQLAESTNGKLLQLDQTEQLIKQLNERGDITSIEYRDASFNGLIDFKFLFFLLLLLLSLEWFLRRWLGAY